MSTFSLVQLIITFGFTSCRILFILSSGNVISIGIYARPDFKAAIIAIRISFSLLPYITIGVLSFLFLSNI